MSDEITASDAAQDTTAAAEGQEVTTEQTEQADDKPLLTGTEQATESSEGTADAPTYEFQLPEGHAIQDDVKAQFVEAIKSGNAQALVDMHLKSQQDIVTAMKEQQAAEVQSWHDDALKQLGNNKDAVISTASRAVDAYMSKESMELLARFGLDRNVNLLKDFAKIGESIREGRGLPDGNPAKGGESLYPGRQNL